jgi:hypothetical protein
VRKGKWKRRKTVNSLKRLLTALSIFTTSLGLTIVKKEEDGDDEDDFGPQWSDNFEPTAMLVARLGWLTIS